MRRLFLFLNNIFFLVAVLFIFRIAFLLRYGDPASLAARDMGLAFLIGLRFDLSTAAYVLAPLTLLVLLPFDPSKKKVRGVFSALSLTWFTAIIVYLFVDLIYYSFAGRHLTFEIFNATGDVLPLVRIGAEKYLPEVLFLILFLAGFILCYLAAVRRICREDSATGRGLLRDLAVYAANFAIVAGLTVVMARGGFQMKPQKMSEAYASFHSAYLGNLAINGVYTSLRTLYSARKNREELWWNIHYMSPEKAGEKERLRIISPVREEVPDPAYPLFRRFRYGREEAKPLNVVIFVMESWTGKYTGSVGGAEDATPFFSSLSKEGLLFRNFFANGQRSIEGISAVLTSLPPWGGMILSLNATLSQMPVRFLPAILEDVGYKTFFIHGAKYDSMGFAGFTNHVGLRNYISRKEIRDSGGRDDGVWGIYDEDTFKYAHRLFSEQTQPFLAVIFSLSSHTPYKLPSKEFEYYGKDRPHADFLNSLRYSDYALSEFFKEAREARYFRDTVFIIVGDHTEGSASRGNLYDMFHTPCLIYSPAHIKPAVIESPASQVDLSPTVLDILKSASPHASTGISAFNHGLTDGLGSGLNGGLKGSRGGQGLLAYGDLMVFVKDDWLLLSSTSNSEGLFNYRLNPSADLSAGERTKLLEMEDHLHSHLQFIGDLVSRNRLFPAGYPAK